MCEVQECIFEWLFVCKKICVIGVDSGCVDENEYEFEFEDLDVEVDVDGDDDGYDVCEEDFGIHIQCYLYIRLDEVETVDDDFGAR